MFKRSCAVQATCHFTGSQIPFHIDYVHIWNVHFTSGNRNTAYCRQRDLSRLSRLAAPPGLSRSRCLPQHPRTNSEACTAPEHASSVPKERCRLELLREWFRRSSFRLRSICPAGIVVLLGHRS